MVTIVNINDKVSILHSPALPLILRKVVVDIKFDPIFELLAVIQHW